jgi:hypothetical protein
MDPSFPYLSVGGSAIAGVPEQVPWTAVPEVHLHAPEPEPSMLTVEGVTLVRGVALHAGIRTFRRLRG